MYLKHIDILGEMITRKKFHQHFLNFGETDTSIHYAISYLHIKKKKTFLMPGRMVGILGCIRLVSSFEACFGANVGRFFFQIMEVTALNLEWNVACNLIQTCFVFE